MEEEEECEDETLKVSTNEYGSKICASCQRLLQNQLIKNSEHISDTE